MFNSDNIINAYSEKYDSQRKHGTAERMHENICTRAQCDVNKKAPEVDQPFPTKPVSHKRLPRKQDRLGLQDFEKNTLSSQHRDHLMQLEYHSGDIRETPRSFHSQKYKMQSKEQQMARAIQVRELLLQEKLQRVGEKIRQTILSSSSDIAAGFEQKYGKERHYTGQDEWGEVNTKGTLSDYQREPLRRRDMLNGESLHEDLMQLRIKRGQRTEDTIKNKHDVQQARWDDSEYSSVQSNLRLGKLSEHFRRKKEIEKDYSVWKETGARYREQNKASEENTTLTREKKYKERTQNDTNGSDNKQNMSQKSLQWLATGNQRYTGENQHNELSLPVLSGSFKLSQQQAELMITDTKGGSFQLLPCEFCNRTFQIERLEKHIQVCAKLNLKQRQVFNSSAQRYKGTQLEEYFKTHNRNKTPEVLSRKKRQNHKGNL